MSTESFVRVRGGSRGIGILLFAVGAVTSARAVESDFRPSMTFGVFHDGNLAVTGTEQGDDGAALAFDLLLERKTPTSTFTFSYRPSYTAYRERSDLDYFGNTLILGFLRESSLTSRLSVDAYASRTEFQGRTAETADRATTFVPRTTLTQGNVKVGGTSGAGRRGLLDWQLRAGTDRYEDVEDDPTTIVDETHDFNDSIEVGGRFGWRDQLSTRNTLGVGLDVAHFGFENTPGVFVGTLGLVGSCQAGASWLLDYSAGVSRATSDGESINGFSLDTKIAYAAARESTFSAGVRQVFAPGTGLGGATQDRALWISYAHAPTARGISGSVLASYSQRDLLEFGTTSSQGDTTTAVASGSIGWSFNRFIAVNASGAYVDQRARNVTDPVLAAVLDTNYASYGIYLRWAIRGR